MLDPKTLPNTATTPYFRLYESHGSNTTKEEVVCRDGCYANFEFQVSSTRILHPCIMNSRSNFRLLLVSQLKLAQMLKPSKWENGMQPPKRKGRFCGA